jgi:hypothetical protein
VARTIGARIARTARRERGNNACAHGGYGSSCGDNGRPQENWCSDFAKWVWHQARVPYADELTPEAGSFGEYARKHGTGLHKRPRVGDAVLFNFRWEPPHTHDKGNADHVAIVVKVFPNGYIRSIGGNEGVNDFHASYVQRDYYSGAIEYSPYWHYSISGYVSPVEDDLPYTENRIRRFVEQGVRAELKKGRKTHKEIEDLVVKCVTNELNDPNTKIAKDLQKLMDRLPAPTVSGTGDGPAVNAGLDGAPRPS